MKCLQCNAAMKGARENFAYDSCGLPGITLVGIEVQRCPKCGEEEVAIPRIEELHRLLALALVKKPARLAPPEIRFLRKYLGWSGRDFAAYMGVTAETVSRWEQGQESMGVPADRLLRLMVVHGEPKLDYSLDILRDVGKGQAPPLRMGVKLDKRGWRAAA